MFPFYSHLRTVGNGQTVRKSSRIIFGGGRYPRGTVVLYNYDEHHRPPEPTGLYPVVIVSGLSYGKEFNDCRLGIPLYPPEEYVDPEAEFLLHPGDITPSQFNNSICHRVANEPQSASFYGLNVLNTSNIVGVCGRINDIGVLNELVRKLYTANQFDVPRSEPGEELFNHGQIFTAYFSGLGSRAWEGKVGPKPFECRVGGEKRRPAICITSWLDKDDYKAPGLISCVPLTAHPGEMDSGTIPWIQEHINEHTWTKVGRVRTITTAAAGYGTVKRAASPFPYYAPDWVMEQVGDIMAVYLEL